MIGIREQAKNVPKNFQKDSESSSFIFDFTETNQIYRDSKEHSSMVKRQSTSQFLSKDR